MTKVFLTGGTGFIGSHLLRCASDLGLDITAIRRSHSAFIGRSDFSLNWLNADLDSITSSDLLGTDVLVHLASVGVSPQIASVNDMHYFNVLALKRLLQNAYFAGIKKIVIAGSFMEYGLTADNYYRIPPDAELLPITPYGHSKAQAFQMVYDFCSKHNMSLKYARISNVFGDGQPNLNLFSKLKKAALAGHDFDMTLGEQVRDFVPINTVCNDLLEAITNFNYELKHPLVFNICSGEGVSVADFCTQWWNDLNAVGKLNIGKIEYRPNEIWRVVGLPHNAR